MLGDARRSANLLAITNHGIEKQPVRLANSYYGRWISLATRFYSRAGQKGAPHLHLDHHTILRERLVPWVCVWHLFRYVELYSRYAIAASD